MDRQRWQTPLMMTKGRLLMVGCWVVIAVFLVPYSIFSTHSLIMRYYYLPVISVLQPTALLVNNITQFLQHHGNNSFSSSFSNVTSSDVVDSSFIIVPAFPKYLFRDGNNVTITAAHNNNNNNEDNNDNDDDNEPRRAIFYNIFIHPNDPNHGINIIKEQTLQIYDNLAAQGRLSQVPLYYNIIGYNYSDRFCVANMTCIFLQYYEKAFEEVTLQSLYEYCQLHSHDEVYYLHNKGSFSRKHANQVKRQAFTNDLLDKVRKRLTINNKNNNCNAASVGWEPLPHTHFRANFWLAKCSYIRHLIPPKDFERVRADLFRRLLHPRHGGNSSIYACLRSFFNESMHNIYDHSIDDQLLVGVGRYNNEYWLTSHPDLIPCDGAQTAFFGNITTKWHYRKPYAAHEWFRMHGRLYEYYQLYGKVPSNASFFWNYFAPLKEPLTPEWCKRGLNRSSYFQKMP